MRGLTAAASAKSAITDAAQRLIQPLLVAAALSAVRKADPKLVRVTLLNPDGVAYSGTAVANALRRVQSVTALEALRATAAETVIVFAYQGRVRDLVEAITTIQGLTFRLEPSNVVNREMTFIVAAP